MRIRLSIRGKLGLLALLLFVVSLQLPAVSADGFFASANTGYDIFKLGWVGPIVGNFAWYGNIFALLAYILPATSRLSVMSACIGGMLAVQSLALEGTEISTIDRTANFGRLLIGYYVWLAALYLGVVATFLGYRAARNQKPAIDFV